MARINAILFSRHCHRAIICYISAPATCATFFNSRHWRSCAVVQVPSTGHLQVYISRLKKDVFYELVQKKESSNIFPQTVQYSVYDQQL